MGFLPLAFAAPLALAALAALPVLYWLLRVTPPRPTRIDFPPLRILADLIPLKETVARTPLWLLLLRIGIAAVVILALAGPVWNARRGEAVAGGGPLLLVVDNGWPSAPTWAERIALSEQYLLEAERGGRAVALLATAGRPGEVGLLDAAALLERLRGLNPEPHRPDRGAHAPRLAAFLDRTPAASVVWITDGLGQPEPAGAPDPLMAVLAERALSRSVLVHRDAQARPLALVDVQNQTALLTVRALRAEANGREGGLVRALDRKGLALGEARFAFAPGAIEASAELDLPLDLRNEVARLEIADERSAGAVALLDASAKRRRVGVVTRATADTDQLLLSPSYYLVRALAPFAEVREGRGSLAEAVTSLLDEKPAALVLADVGAVPSELRQRLANFIADGGVVIRFAGSRLAAANDEFVPVRLRRGGRTLGGTLSWETPRTLAPFSDESPFAGLTPPAEVNVTRQILAEPDPQLAGRTWAALADGTPVVTGERRGRGTVALFHVTADTAWSNLPLSGLFPELLRTLVGLSTATGDPVARTAGIEEAALAPLRTLDGRGAFRAPPPTAKPVAPDFKGRASEDHPPGFYGAADSPLAVNALSPGERLNPLQAASAGLRTAGIEAQRAVDLRPWLFALGLVGLLADTLAVLALGGAFARFVPRRLSAAAASIAAVALLSILAAPDAHAQSQAAPASPSSVPKRESEAALATRLAYVVTGDSVVDETSRAGLAGLTAALAQRTALEPGEPVGVDPARDELSLYPLVYWPIVANRPAAPAEAVRRLDLFMRGGGTVLFDTRDALTARPGTPSVETLALRRLLQGLDVPEIEPVPRDHVVTKSFYLIDRFPGRYDAGPAWIETLPPVGTDGRQPARAGDGVSPLIITGNDLAAAWAIGRRGEPLYPTVGSDPRQRELSLRGGVNIVLYTLTGNYKADQVHVPDLLQRLGQ